LPGSELEKAVTPGPFILGQRFSAEDVYIGSEIGWGMMTKGLEPRPSKRISSRFSTPQRAARDFFNSQLA
jgi:hypothetical protein